MTGSALPRAIFLMGPTASGKTAAAIELVQRFPLEIISVDSALVYRGMDIGTAKPDAATLAVAPHHLIDIIDPTAAYSAAQFRRDALRLMEDIRQRGRIPLLVGGTMLYFKALREGLDDLPEADAELRATLDADIAQRGIHALHQELATVDPVTAARLQANDTQRIQRALEIYRASGQPMSYWLAQQSRTPLPWDVVPFALLPSDRAQLHQRIATRFQQMLAMGLVDEVQNLREKFSLHPTMPSMRCVGYRQAWQYLDGELNAEALYETGVAATRQLAKRQLTWLRSMPQSIALDCLDPQLNAKLVDLVAGQL